MRAWSNRHDGDASVARDYTSITWVACQNGDLLGTVQSDDGTEMGIGYRRLGTFSNRRGSVGLSRVEDHVRDPQAVGEGPRNRGAVPTSFNPNRGRNLNVDWNSAALPLGNDLDVAEHSPVLRVLDCSKSLNSLVV